MAPIEAMGLTCRYGRITALDHVDLEVPEGAIYALLGRNGAGKTTLIQLLMGLRRPTAGEVRLLGKTRKRLAVADRARIGYVPERPSLPGWMRLRELESYVAPLYPSWDADLADQLRDRFGLDPEGRLRTFSRGDHMKSALLCALAPRPDVLLMDEPFGGMDVVVRDELVRGLLESVGSEGWTVLLSSHEVSELETLADWVGVLHRGRLRLSEPIDRVRERFRAVEVVLPEGTEFLQSEVPDTWGRVERAGRRLRFVLADAINETVVARIRRHMPEGAEVETCGATLKDVFVRLSSDEPRTAAIR